MLDFVQVIYIIYDIDLKLKFPLHILTVLQHSTVMRVHGVTSSRCILPDPGQEAGDPGGHPRVAVTSLVLPAPAGQSNQAPPTVSQVLLFYVI